MRPIPLTLTLALLLAAPGTALHCNGDITTIGAGAATLYLDDRSTTTGEINHWIYLESNGFEGLQSGGGPPILLDPTVPFILDDLCAHANPDTLIF